MKRQPKPREWWVYFSPHGWSYVYDRRRDALKHKRDNFGDGEVVKVREVAPAKRRKRSAK